MKIKILLLLFGICLIESSCKKQYGEFYATPTGQAGHIYEQIAADPSLSIFVSAVDKVPGLKDILNTSGLYTVMAPDNDAFAKYFASQQYKSISDIPTAELSQMIKFHVLKYMLFQVNFLSPGINKTSFDIFKYETQNVPVYNDKLANGQLRSIFYTGRQMQIYTPYYFAANNVTLDDYKAVYGTEAHLSSSEIQLNAMGAAVIKKDIASGNGAIHIIDRVLTPPKNIAQELDTNPEFADYSAILKKRFLTYTYNQNATKAQGNNGDINGDGIVDSLWTRTYSINPNLDNENPIAPDKSALSLTIFAPSKASFSSYLATKFLPFFSNNMDLVPASTLALLYNSQFTTSMDWPSKVDRDQIVSVGADKQTITKADIVSVKMASNGLFYTLNKVLEPAAFTAVSGPAFFSPTYSYMAEMLNQTGLLGQLSNSALKYTVLGVPNAGFTNAGINLITSPTTKFTRLRTGGTTTDMSVSELRDVIGNNVLVGTFSVSQLTNGFYPTLSGNYVAITSGQIEGSVRGSKASIINPDISKSNGYFQGVDKLTSDPQLSVYDNVAASISPNPTPYSYSKFRELCSAVGILSKDFVSITGVDAGKKFTLFVPSNEAITAAQAANLLPKTATGSPALDVVTKARLFAYIKFFFIQQQVFTDGKLTGVFATSKLNGAGLPVNLTVSYPGNVLTVSDGSAAQGRAIINNTGNYPQNVIAKDGVIQVIDNAFTSQY
jgi:uncharacterized surface protein with fasciclin (FAS1) repeats